MEELLSSSLLRDDVAWALSRMQQLSPGMPAPPFLQSLADLPLGEIPGTPLGGPGEEDAEDDLHTPRPVRRALSGLVASPEIRVEGGGHLPGAGAAGKPPVSGGSCTPSLDQGPLVLAHSGTPQPVASPELSGARGLPDGGASSVAREPPMHLAPVGEVAPLTASTAAAAPAAPVAVPQGGDRAQPPGDQAAGAKRPRHGSFLEPTVASTLAHAPPRPQQRAVSASRRPVSRPAAVPVPVGARVSAATKAEAAGPTEKDAAAILSSRTLGREASGRAIAPLFTAAGSNVAAPSSGTAAGSRPLELEAAGEAGQQQQQQPLTAAAASERTVPKARQLPPWRPSVQAKARVAGSAVPRSASAQPARTGVPRGAQVVPTYRDAAKATGLLRVNSEFEEAGPPARRPRKTIDDPVLPAGRGMAAGVPWVGQQGSATLSARRKVATPRAVLPVQPQRPSGPSKGPQGAAEIPLAGPGPRSPTRAPNSPVRTSVLDTAGEEALAAAATNQHSLLALPPEGALFVGPAGPWAAMRSGGSSPAGSSGGGSRRVSVRRLVGSQGRGVGTPQGHGGSPSVSAVTEEGALGGGYIRGDEAAFISPGGDEASGGLPSGAMYQGLMESPTPPESGKHLFVNQLFQSGMSPTSCDDSVAPPEQPELAHGSGGNRPIGGDSLACPVSFADLAASGLPQLHPSSASTFAGFGAGPIEQGAPTGEEENPTPPFLTAAALGRLLPVTSSSTGTPVPGSDQMSVCLSASPFPTPGLGSVKRTLDLMQVTPGPLLHHQPAGAAGAECSSPTGMDVDPGSLNRWAGATAVADIVVTVGPSAPSPPLQPGAQQHLEADGSGGRVHERAVLLERVIGLAVKLHAAGRWQELGSVLSSAALPGNAQASTAWAGSSRDGSADGSARLSQQGGRVSGAARGLRIGDVVILGRRGSATVRYFGPCHWGTEEVVGLELGLPEGQHSGAVDGVVYFQCSPMHGKG